MEAKAGLLQRLADMGIHAPCHDHPPIHTMQAAAEHWNRLPGTDVKNLYLKDAKRRLFLVSVRGTGNFDMKALAPLIGAARLSFAREGDLAVLGVEKGAVTPLAVVNDSQGLVTLVLDQALMAADRLKLHPLVNTATVLLSPGDLLAFAAACGHPAAVVDLTPAWVAP